MKKVFTFILALFAGFSSVSAQITDTPNNGNEGFGQRPRKQETRSSENSGDRPGIKLKHYNYELSLGPRAALGYSSMAESDGLNVADGGNVNFGVGLGVNLRFGGKDSKGRYLDGQGLFGIGLEVNYKNQGSKIKGNDDLSLSCIEVPLMLQFYPCYNSKQLKNLYVEFGPTFSTALSVSPKNVVYNYVDQTPNHFYSKELTYKTDEIKGMDVKLAVGLGYRFSKMSANDGFYANARYYIGTSNLAGNFPGKISSAELSIGYMFKAIGTKKK